MWPWNSSTPSSPTAESSSTPCARSSAATCWCTPARAGAAARLSFRTLADYALIDEYDNPDGFEHIRYYRLSDRGREFAERAVQAWERRPLIERLAARLLG